MEIQPQKNPFQWGASPLPTLLLIPALILAIIVGALIFLQGEQWPKQIACTDEAKICPDGSAVSRTRPNCEFAACPDISKVLPTRPPANLSPAPTVDPTPATSLSAACCSRTETRSGYKCVASCSSTTQRQFGRTTYTCLSPEELTSRETFGCPICMALNTVISTPKGDKYIQDIKTGDSVWSTDKRGKKVASSVSQVFRSKVPSNHTVFHLVLADKREVWMSPNHPLSNGKTIGDLKVGYIYDKSSVKTIDLIKYAENNTYDILPDSDTGFYWANGVLVGSTLK